MTVSHLPYAAVLVAVTAGLGACTTGSEPIVLTCDELDAGTTADVSGAFRYSSPLFHLSGTITFEQTGNTVQIVDTTYDTVDDRKLSGAGELQGNRLDVVLVPTNGDTDYSADVSFAFNAAGDSFCIVGFSDTNDDVGGAGSYRGRRL